MDVHFNISHHVVLQKSLYIMEAKLLVPVRLHPGERNSTTRVSWYSNACRVKTHNNLGISVSLAAHNYSDFLSVVFGNSHQLHSLRVLAN